MLDSETDSITFADLITLSYPKYIKNNVHILFSNWNIHQKDESIKIKKIGLLILSPRKHWLFKFLTIFGWIKHPIKNLCSKR